MSHKNLIFGISVVVLCLFVTTPVWGENCKRINTKFLRVGEILWDPECNGYDACRSFELKGTPNGVYTFYANFDTMTPYEDETTFVFVDDVVIETEHGEIFAEERVIRHKGAPDGPVIHANITGGTGRYEGATGWYGVISWSVGEEGYLDGEMCYPGAGEE